MTGDFENIKNRTVAIVPAAGVGERLGLGPKGLLCLNGRTLLEHLVDTLEQCVSRIVIGAGTDRVDQVQELLGDHAEVIAGGATRQATLQKLFEYSEEPLVLIHDATRPFASTGLIKKVMMAGHNSGAASAFIHPHIPVGRIEEGRIVEAFAKSEVMLPQSPQACHREILGQVFQYALSHTIQTQTLWQILVLMGQPVTVVEGEERNIKITTPFDWDVARKVIGPDYHNHQGKSKRH